MTFPSDLLNGYAESLRQALKTRGGRTQDVAAATGISPSWIEKFRVGKMKNPTLSKIITLAEYLEKM
jgi:transcriptional regulator with XRE-family HTH domain